MHFTHFSPFLLLCSATAASFESLKMDPAHGMLMENMKMVQEKAGPFTYNINNNPYAPSLPISCDLLIQITEYLDYEGLKSFGAVCRHFYKVKNDFITLKLVKIDGYLLFREDWFNEVVFRVLYEHFPREFDAEDVYDLAELMALKYHLKNYKLKNIPKQIYLEIISFIYGVIHKTEEDEAAGFTIDSNFKYSLATKVQQYPMHLTLNYYSPMLNSRLKLILQFFAGKPDVESQRAFMDRYGNIKNCFGPCFEFIFMENLGDAVIKGESALKLLKDTCIFSVCSYKLLDRIEWSQNLMQTISNESKIWFSRYLYKKFRYETVPGIGQIWMADDATEFSDVNARKIFLSVVNEKIPHVLQFHILRQLIRSGKLNLDRHIAGEPNIFSESLAIDLPVLELILDETPSPVNLFSQHGWARNSMYLDIVEPDRIALILRKQLLTNPKNPLALLFFMGPLLPDFKSEIFGKFDLSTKYIFDGNFSHFACGTFSDSQLQHLEGSIKSFEEILEFLNNPRLTDAFGKSKISKSIDQPIYSLKEYFNTAVLKDVSSKDI